MRALASKSSLLSPVRAGRLSLRNRVVMPAHTTNFAVDGGFSDQHLEYHRTRAAGGVGLIVTEGMRVHPSSLGRTNTVSAFDDRIIDSLARLVAAVHGEGAKLTAQLLHVGRLAGSHNVLTAPWGASPIPWAGTAAVPHEMTRAEIAEVVAAFGAAAHRAEAAGVDALELHLGHGHLLQQFLSPATNHRADDYGGPLGARLRFAREAIESVLAAVPSELPLLLRISADEFLPGGLDLPQMLEAMAPVLRDYPVDVLHVSHSAYVGARSVATQIADMSFPPMPFAHLPRAFKQAYPELAILAVCRVDDLTNAQQLLDEGSADLVALARPHIAAPELVARAGDPSGTPHRSCIACNQGCTGRLELGLPISCVVNPEVGLEAQWQRLRAAAAKQAKGRVIVVGGGPAGLEAALAAAGSGHAVTLVERSDRLGGALQLAARMAMRARFGQMIDELGASVRHAGVQVHLGTVADERLLATGWDHIVLATGGEPASRPIDGLLPTVPLADAIERPGELGEHVALIDEEGSWTGLALADHLMTAGRRVTLLSAQPAIAWRVPVYSRPALLDQLQGRELAVELLRTPTQMLAEGLECMNPLTASRSVVSSVSSVVFLRAPTPRLNLRSHLSDRDLERCTVVGDAYAPRTALEAAYEGRLAGLCVIDAPAVASAAAQLRGRL